MKLGSLIVEIGADTKSFIKGSDDTKRRLVQLGQQSRSTVNSLGKIAGAAAAAGTALAATIVVQAANAARELQNMSDIANTTPEIFQKMAFGARRVGIEQDKLSDILKDFNDRVGDFNQTGAGPMADFFEKIGPKVGVTAEQFKNLSGPQSLQLFVDSLEKANLAQEDMTFYMEAMASDSTALIPLLRNGGEAMAAQADEAERLGLILSDIDTERLSQLSDQIAVGKDMFSAFTSQIGAELTPVMSVFMDQLKETAEDMGGIDEVAMRVVEAGVSGFGAFADILRGVQVAGKSLQLGFQGVGTALLSVSSLVLEGWQRVFDMILSGIQGAVDAANAIPGVNIPTDDLVTFRQRTLAAAEGQVQLRETMHKSLAQTKDELHELAMQPMPSEQFDKFLAEAREKSDAAAEAAVEARQKMAQETAGRAAGGGDEEDAIAEAELEKRLERIRQANLSELELLREKQAMEAEILAEGRERGLEIKGGYDEAEKEMEARHQKDLTALTQSEAEARRRAEEENLRSREATTGQILGNISSLMNTESRKMFEIGKAAAIGNAIVSTYEAAANALADVPYPLNIAAAAGIAAQGFAQVSAIRSQSFGSGGGAAGSATQQASAGGQPVQQQQQERSQNLRVEGISRDSLFSGEQMMSTIEQLWKDGAGQGRVIFD